MKEMKRKALKGLTLIELIVVMAIFSILIVAIVQFFSPVERIFKNTAVSEKTYAYTNNIEDILQEKLKYSDILWTFNASKVDTTEYGPGNMTDASITKICEDIASMYYNGVVMAEKAPGASSVTEHYAKGKIHVMRLVNNTVGSLTEGQITERTVEFSCDPTLASKLTGSLSSETTLVNDAYFKAADAKYRFHYALGAGRLVNDLDNSGAIRVVDKDYNDTPIGLTYSEMNISIVTVGDGDMIPESGTVPFSMFNSPCTIAVANLPLNNIVYCHNHTSNRTTKMSPTNSSGVALPTMVYAKQDGGIVTPPESFKISDSTGASFINETMNFTDDIYLFYTYADELK